MQNSHALAFAFLAGVSKKTEKPIKPRKPEKKKPKKPNRKKN